MPRKTNYPHSPLKKWVEKNKITLISFFEDNGFNRASMLSNLRTGRISLSILKKIQECTNGEVTIQDMAEWCLKRKEVTHLRQT